MLCVDPGEAQEGLFLRRVGEASHIVYRALSSGERRLGV
jgi:hypothetical protein